MKKVFAVIILFAITCSAVAHEEPLQRSREKKAPKKSVVDSSVMNSSLKESMADFEARVTEQMKIFQNSYARNIYVFTIPKELSFCGERVPLEDQDVRERFEREFYLNLADASQIVMNYKRAGRYFPMMEEEFRKRGIPSDMKYLAVAESGLRNVRSPKNAMGLWQFIEPTGKKMNLQIDEYVDERLNPSKATIAGIGYLKEGYTEFHNWTLAAAGYNMGHGNVAEALGFQGVKSYYQLYLNDETSRYIFRILAIKEILEHASRYGIPLQKIEQYQAYKTKIIKEDDEIPNIAQWAREHGTTYRDLKTLNPWMLKQRLPKPAEDYLIEVPVK